MKLGLPLKWRFFCQACTGRAMYAPEPTVFNQVSCLNCGAIVPYDANGWFEITDQQEYQKVNGGLQLES